MLELQPGRANQAIYHICISSVIYVHGHYTWLRADVHVHAERRNLCYDDPDNVYSTDVLLTSRTRHTPDSPARRLAHVHAPGDMTHEHPRLQRVYCHCQLVIERDAGVMSSIGRTGV